MRTCGVMLVLVMAVAGLSVAVMTADTFRERLQHHREVRRQAFVYSRSPHCQAATRSALGKFHRCDEAERILQNPPEIWMALRDVCARVPELAQNIIQSVRQDLLKVMLTGVAVWCVWVWVRRWTAPRRTWYAGNVGYTLPVSKPFKSGRLVHRNWDRAQVWCADPGPEIEQVADY